MDTGYSIAAVRYADILSAPNAADLLHAYAQECSIAELGPVTPQEDIYALLEASGRMQCFAVYRAADWRLVGLAAVIVDVNPHYGVKLAVTESLFVEKDARRMGCGLALLGVVEAHAREQGALALGVTVRAESQLEKLLSYMPAYEQTNSIFLRVL